MFKKIIEQRNRLAVFTTVILILESVLFPNGWMGRTQTAQAGSTYSWTFDNASDYTLTTGLGISKYDGTNNALHFKINGFSATGLGTGLPADGITHMVRSVIDGKLWATTGAGRLYYSSDAGAKWTIEPDLQVNSKTVKSIINTDTSLIIVADGGDAFSAYYSTDGATWSPSATTMGGAKGFVDVSYDGSTLFGVLSDGVVTKSANDGALWELSKTADGIGHVTAPKDIVCAGTGVVATSGLSGGTAAITYTLNGGASWSVAHFPGSPSNITSLGYVNGWLYAQDANYLININIAGGKSMANSDDWNNITANIAGGTLTAGATIFSGLNSNITFIGLKPKALYSTIDNGAHWLLHNPDDDGASPIVASDWMWNSDGSKLLWGGTDGTDAHVRQATVTPNGTVAITQVGPTDVRTITSITASAHSLSYGETKVSFSTAKTEVGPWHFYDGANWQTSEINSATDATAVSALTEQVLATLPITGEIYIKIYPPTTASTLILDTLSISYGTAGGPGASNDKTAPSSQVNALAEYSSAPDLCNPILTVTATASDTGGSSVASVTLYMREAGSSFVKFGDPDTSQPYEWSVPVRDTRTYFFYTIAVDTAIPPNTEGSPAGVEGDTSTTVDVSAPWFVNSDPHDAENEVSINRPIVVAFNEPIKPETFQVQVYSGEDNFVQDLQFTWSGDATTVTIDHPALEFLTRYYVNVTVAQDRAGNDWQDLKNCFSGKGGSYDVSRPVPQFYFNTQKKMDPDLLLSRLILEDKLYHPEDLAEYTLQLNNSSIYGGDNVTVTIRFASGISFVEAKDIRFRTIEENGKVVGLEWNGSIPGSGDIGHIIESKFVMQVDTPANNLTISQTGTIDDGVNPIFTMAPPAIMHIARHPIFDQSSNKLVDKSEARHGDVLFYTITIKNTGTTIADIAFSDYIPREDNPDGTPLFFFKPGSEDWDHSDQRWTEVPDYDEATQTLHGIARDVLPGSPALTISFATTVRGGVYDTYIINEARVWDPNLDPQLPPATTLTAQTHIPGGPPPPLRVAYQSPTPNTDNNNLKQNIEIGFNSEVSLAEPFDIYLSVNGEDLNIEDWLPSWSQWNEIPNSGKLTLFPPDGKLEMGATYEIAIESGSNVAGGELAGAPVVWSFTTAAPMIDITTPTDQVYETRVNDYGKLFTIVLSDEISGKTYRAEEDVTIGLTATYVKNHLLRDSSSFYQETTDLVGNKFKTKLAKDSYGISKVVIPKGSSTAYFYYFDTQVTGTDILKVNTFDYPDNGWVDSFKFVTVVDEQPPRSLTITAPDKITSGQYSSAITVRATDEAGRPMPIPAGKLYLHTDSSDGLFYDASHNPLPTVTTGESLTVQSIGVPQYVDIGALTNSLTLYYKSSQVGSQTLIISDNDSINLEPDINLNDAMAIISVTKPTEEDILLELEDVEDETGRTVDHITLAPTTVSMLPSGKQEFTAVAYDTENKVITGLKFKWFALITKSGTIEKNGHGDSSKSTFTASTALGTYYDDVMVATLYNGKIGYATATVKIVDVVDIDGPKHLPVTGMNGLQLVLMALTLAAAVALAWVEHYDKTHFSGEK